MNEISENLLSDEDVLKIKRELRVCIKSEYSADKRYNVYSYDSSRKTYKLPLYWACTNLSYEVKPKFKDLETLNFGVLLSKPRQNQIECTEKCTPEINKSWGGGIINMATGTGKTYQSLILVTKIKRKTLIVVHTIDLLQQWTASIKEFLPKCRIGYIKGGVFDIDNVDIVIGMLQTISMKSEYTEDMFSSFGLTIYDEVQFLGAEVFSKALLKSRSRYVFGLSATIERKDGLERVFQNHIGKILYSNLSSDLKQYTIIDYVHVSGECIEINMYNDSPNIAAMITSISEDKKRTDVIIDKLLSMNDDRRILVLSDRINQLKYMNKILGDGVSGLYIGKMKENDKKISKTKKILLATYNIASVGFDHPVLNTIVFATPRSSVTQAIGRIYRKEHSIQPMIVDIVDDFSIFKYQFKKRKKTYSKLISTKNDECLFE